MCQAQTAISSIPVSRTPANTPSAGAARRKAVRSRAAGSGRVAGGAGAVFDWAGTTVSTEVSTDTGLPPGGGDGRGATGDRSNRP
ncbi:hypothetical protein GCM10010329_18660 [Streptomyces spiroverticillatus]|uniref:Uncharacterized protein n=1 Tax=Streptomyces finlayi TaxID=67296 RepID=A0A919C7R3_9ACTN|nr:hypothetical protein GCM10010329_18660 [Streptomyces spiroverticillatus]GHC82701.1 hypothetical protein GCM10010334_11140 [Streptomyces finlayi]